MKKRTMILVLMLLCVTSLCFAAKEYKKEIKIQGGYDAVASISVTPIPSQAESYKIGMPFAIDDPSVQQGASARGRLIANWSILANFPMLIDVEAEVMHHSSENELANYEHGLGYRLVFVYSLSYTKDGVESHIPNAFFPIPVPKGSAKTVTVSNIDLLGGQTIEKDSLVGSADGEVFFTFDESTTNNIIKNPTEFEKLPNGNYIANVTLKMKAK